MIKLREKREQIKGICKKVLSISFAVICTTGAVWGAYRTASAYARVSDTLSTSESLNSPVLNNQFSNDSWNPWEMVCWGVFLSNFCNIGIDDYESAFSTSSNYGSKGNGYQALVFSTGNDTTNNETIQELLNYAVNAREQSGTKQIYIGKDSDGKKSRIENSEPVKVDIANYDSSQYQAATIKDLFTDDFVVDMLNNVDSSSNNRNVNSQTYYDRDFVKSCTANTFYIDNDGLIEVWDNLDSWDIQILGSLIGKIGTSTYSDAIQSSLNWAYANNAPLLWDCFGNICYKDENSRLVVLIPSCSNQHITVDPKINLLTSLVMNGGTGMSSYSGEDLLCYAAIDNYDPTVFGNLWSGASATNNGEAGHNAVGSQLGASVTGKAVLYYDTDSIIWMANNRQYNHTEYGNVLAALFGCDGNATTGGTYPLKIGIIGSGSITDKVNENNGVAHAAIFSNLASTMADQCASISTSNQEVLSYYRDFSDTHKIELFSDDAVYVAVSNNPGYDDDGKETSWYMPRKFMNYLGQRYNDKSLNADGSTDITVSGLTLEQFRSKIKSITWAGTQSGYGSTGSTGFVDTTIGGIGYVSNIYRDFIIYNQNLYDVADSSKLLDKSADLKWVALSHSPSYSGRNMLGWKMKVGGTKVQQKYTSSDGWFSRAMNLSENDFPLRVIKTWGQSSVMQSICNYLNVSDGTDFSASASFIYLSYLDYYGLDSSTDNYGNVSTTSDFKEKLFNWAPDVLPSDVSELINAVSEEDMEKDILRLAYLSLAQTDEGREYRKNIMINGINDFVYEQYCRIVYGTSGVESSVTSKSNSSFLRVHTLDENFMTNVVLEKYAEIAIWLLGALIIFLVVVGLLKGRKLSWFIITTIVTITSVLVLPSIGDMIPYASNRAIQSMFKDKMTYWSLSEMIENYSQEKTFTEKSGSQSYSDSLSDEETQAVMSIVDSLDSLQLDRSLMVKQDISNKMLNVGSETSNRLQQYQSTRWILPLVMQQYSADDSDTADNIYDYVYVNLTDTITDAANIYWWYNPNARTGIMTVAAQSDWNTFSRYGGDPSSGLHGSNLTVFNMNTLYSVNGFASQGTSITDMRSINSSNDRVSYRAYSYWRTNNIYGDTNINSQYNRWFYIANGNGVTGDSSCDFYVPSIASISRVLGDDWTGFQEDSDIEGLVEAYKTGGNIASRLGIDTSRIDRNLQNLEKLIEKNAEHYTRNDGSTFKCIYPYLDSTESPLTYFYITVQEYFNDDDSYASIVKSIEGGFDYEYKTDANGNYIEDTGSDDGLAQYDEDDDGAEESLRVSMTNQRVTGYTTDVLDLQTMFECYIPYMYEMTILTGGTDGTDGLLGDATVSSDLATYEGSLQSWLFRCNWAAKIIENPDYCKDTTIGIRDADGNVVEKTIKNAALPSEYVNAGREMVFSEAQQKKLGLKDEDLSLCELECIKINNAVAKKWTYLLNYVGTEGMNREILIRQMAIDANLIFNTNISSPTVVNTKYEMYPSSLDLRTISFDSIMKMLCLNMTSDTSYLYGNTMEVLIDDSDLFTSILLLLCAFLCCYVVGLVRDFTVAVIFYSSIIHIIHNITRTNKSKVKVTMGTFVSTLVVTVATIAYYGILSLMVSLTSTEEVLNSNTVQLQTGNPVWLFLAVIILSCAYIFGIVYFCIKIIKYTPEEVYDIAANLSADVRDRVSDRMNKVKDSVTGMNKSVNAMNDSVTGSIQEASEKNAKSNKAKEADSTIYKNASDAYDEQYKKKNKDVLESNNTSVTTKVEKENINEINNEIVKGKGNINKDSGDVVNMSESK